jgi:hypothetical protein
MITAAFHQEKGLQPRPLESTSAVCVVGVVTAYEQ